MFCFNGCQKYEIAGFSIDLCSQEWNWTLNSNSAIFFHALICCFYAITVWALQQWVRNVANGSSYSPPAWLETIRYWHNISLSAVSLLMLIVMVKEMFLAGRFANFETVACGHLKNEGLYGFINLVYLISKIWEWGDTYFLILTNKPVIWLHYFHHMTTFTMAAVVHNFPVGGYCFINAGVHAVMYLHYAYPVKFARPFITSGQLLQFVTVITVHMYGIYRFIMAPKNGANNLCFDFSNVLREWWFCEIVVVGYFLLFVNFFLQQYVKPSSRKNSGRGIKVKNAE